METAKKTIVNGKEEVVVHPELAELILQQNKKLAEAKELNKKILDMISKV